MVRLTVRGAFTNRTITIIAFTVVYLDVLAGAALHKSHISIATMTGYILMRTIVVHAIVRPRKPEKAIDRLV
jgi:uncharacterized membrane protein AbrB (regulator of aidB expression)